MPTWVKELIALDEALTNLAAADPRKAQVVELRYLGGLSVKETAAVLKVSEDTVARDWPAQNSESRYQPAARRRWSSA